MRSSRPKNDPPAMAAVAAVAPALAAPPEVPVVQELSKLYFDLMLRRADRYQTLVTEFGLSTTQMRTLILMDPQHSMTMSALAKKTMIEPSNLTGIIDKLEARKLAKRSLAPTDRRVKIASLTRSGVTLRTKLFDRIREPAPWMLALSEHDQLQLLHILRKGIAFEQEAANAAKG